MYKNVTGYCPTLGEDYSIRVKYQEISPNAFQGFLKDTFRCDFNACSGSCLVSDCPIYMSAPEKL